MASENSVITNYRREMLCKITSGNITSLPKITKIAFGSGGVDGNGNPIPPLGSATALKTALGQYNIGTVTYPVSTTARYTATIPEGDLVGQNINEAALVDSNGKLCAIKTMYNKRKDAGVTFTFTYDDEF